jgi:hypothetical protein
LLHLLVQDGIELDKTNYEFGPQKIQFLTVKNKSDLPASQDHLWAVQWTSAFAFANFLIRVDNLKDVDILEIGNSSFFLCTVVTPRFMA